MTPSETPILIVVRNVAPDDADALRIGNQIAAHLHHQRPHFILDVRSVEVLNAGFLTRIVELLRIARERGGDIRLSGLRPQLASDLELYSCGLIWQVFEGVTEALESYSHTQS